MSRESLLARPKEQLINLIDDQLQEILKFQQIIKNCTQAGCEQCQRIYEKEK